MLYLTLILSYFWGALLPGYFFFRLIDKKDIRNLGSGNPGATNVFRLKGWKWGLFVFLFDFSKGLAVVLISKSLFSQSWLPLAAGRNRRELGSLCRVKFSSFPGNLTSVFFDRGIN